MDFLRCYVAGIGKDRFECRPDFDIRRSKDLMVKKHEFYAFWNEDKGAWDTDIANLIVNVDAELTKFYEEKKADGAYTGSMSVAYMWQSSSGSIDRWNKYIEKQMYDNYVQLDPTIVFLDDPHTRELYSTHRLSYNMEPIPTPFYDKLFHTLYSPEELTKIEWALGSIIVGDSKSLQKFFVLTGPPGSGKSTVLHVLIDNLFEGYYKTVDANSVAKNAQFAFETVADNPLIGYQDEVNLSNIQENTSLNALVSHEPVVVNKKNKAQYAQRFHTLIFLCSNNEVNITDSKAGIIRRLIDITPTGNKLPAKEYKECCNMIKFELGGIAYHCRQVYLDDPSKYDNYIPTRMMRATNIVYSWLEDKLDDLVESDGITSTSAWKSYWSFCEEANIHERLRLNRLQLQNELNGYFEEFLKEGYLDDGTRVRNYYSGFLYEKFARCKKPEIQVKKESWLEFRRQKSVLDEFLKNATAQYATEDGKPLVDWETCETTLKEIDTSRLHYVLPQKVDASLIVLDFDKKNEGGGKDFLLNKEAAERYPPTYAELSKSGAGIHLHYIFAGDVNKLSAIIEPDVEIKVFPIGKLSSLRRCLTECNDLPIATISSGLPLRKEDKKMVDRVTYETEQHLLNVIFKQLRKETHDNTHQSVSMIKKALDDAYNCGLKYYIPEDVRNRIFDFCNESTNQRADCLKMFDEMCWQSDDDLEFDNTTDESLPLVAFDIEVFPNTMLLCYSEKDKEPIEVWDPSPAWIEDFSQRYNNFGFNCRKYDWQICYARQCGQSLKGCYLQSAQIVDNSVPDSEKHCFHIPAYAWGYADAYDMATKKQSLKKWEIELGLEHKELDWDWNTPLPDELRPTVAEYCKNDVKATWAVWDAIQPDIEARSILAEWAGMAIATPTNKLTTTIIFDGETNTQHCLKWRDLSKPVPKWENEAVRSFLQDECGRFKEPFDEHSVVPYFPGYKFKDGKSTYKGFEVGEGGFVYAEPGMHTNVALIDVESMHPNSFIDEVYAGVRFTRRFKDILDLRVMIKHKDYEAAAKFFNGIFATHLKNKSTAKALAFALKIAINSVYGLTAAHFQNAFYNPQNKDNIVAKRGALFMIDLLEYVEELGYTVAHIKTDSIKIPNATPEIIQKVIDFGHRYGYNFVHEATYEKMCLVNNAVYVAKYQTVDWCQKAYNYIPDDNQEYGGEWTATGAQFQVPYVFKNLFSHEKIIFLDMCETKSVTSTIYLDMDPDGNHDYKFVGKVGQFTPVKSGGGELLRKQGDKYVAVTGTKGYRWLESSDAKALGKSAVDEQYYKNLVDAAYTDISKYGDVEWFLA